MNSNLLGAPAPLSSEQSTLDTSAANPATTPVALTNNGVATSNNGGPEVMATRRSEQLERPAATDVSTEVPTFETSPQLVASTGFPVVELVMPWQDVLNEDARADMSSYCRRQRGIWVMESNRLTAFFVHSESAKEAMIALGLPQVCIALDETELKKYDPKKDVFVYFEAAVDMKCAGDNAAVATRVVKISRGKNTIDRQRIA